MENQYFLRLLFQITRYIFGNISWVLISMVNFTAAPDSNGNIVFSESSLSAGPTISPSRQQIALV